jgi:hypothetical protein
MPGERALDFPELIGPLLFGARAASPEPGNEQRKWLDWLARPAPFFAQGRLTLESPHHDALPD